MSAPRKPANVRALELDSMTLKELRKRFGIGTKKRSKRQVVSTLLRGEGYSEEEIENLGANRTY